MVVYTLVQLRVLSVEGDVDVKVHVSSVPQVWLHTEGPLYLLARVHRQVVPDVEDGLFPVRVGRFWGRCEPDLLV